MEILEVVTKNLMEFKYPKSYSRKNVLQDGDRCYEGFVLGKICSWAHKNVKETGVLITDSKKTSDPRFAELYKLAQDLALHKNEDFNYTTIQFNKNYQCKKHIDGKNIGESCIIGVGDYEGGDLLVYFNGENEEPTKIDIKNKFFRFNGSKYYHETAPFSGQRHTLVYFSR